MSLLRKKGDGMSAPRLRVVAGPAYWEARYKILAKQGLSRVDRTLPPEIDASAPAVAAGFPASVDGREFAREP